MQAKFAGLCATLAKARIPVSEQTQVDMRKSGAGLIQLRAAITSAEAKCNAAGLAVDEQGEADDDNEQGEADEDDEEGEEDEAEDDAGEAHDGKGEADDDEAEADD